MKPAQQANADIQTTSARPATWWSRLGSLISRHPRRAIGLCLLLVFITHLPTDLARFATDDYLHQAVLRGETLLADKGFSHTDPDQPWLNRVANTFHFFNAGQGTTQAQQDYGNLPWWSSTDATMHPFRPLAAATHWLDYTYWPDNIVRIQWHSLVYFYLFVIGGFLVYRRLLLTLPVALLATALLIFDISLSQNLGWIAARNSYMSCGLGMLALWLHMRAREEGCLWSTVLGPAAYALSLLAAEAGIAGAAYLGAYALVLDRRGWWRGLCALAPYVLISLVWRWGYNLHGHGAINLGLYVDPGRDLFAFAEQLFNVFPVIGVSLALGRDALLSGLDLPYREVLRWLSWLLVACFLWLIRELIRTDRRVRFMLLGSVLAVIPHASLLSAGSRSGVFAAIGFFYILAVWLSRLLSPTSGLGARIAGNLILGWHLLLPVVLVVVVSWSLISFPQQPDSLTQQVEAHLQQHPNSSVVIINHPAPSNIFYLPYEWAIDNARLPARVQVLAPALSDLSVRRTGEYSLVVSSNAGLVLHQNVPMSASSQPSPAISEFYIYRLLAGLVTTPDEDFSVGRVFERAGMRVTIAAAVDGVVTEVAIEFTDRELLEDKLWLAYDWETRRYFALAPPSEEARRVLGPM